GDGARYGDGAGGDALGRAVYCGAIVQRGCGAHVPPVSDSLYAGRGDVAGSSECDGRRRGYCEAVSGRGDGAFVREGAEGSAAACAVDADGRCERGECGRVD